MRIVWCGHLYPPIGAAGAEWTAHEFLLAAARRGHTVCYWHMRATMGYDYEGIPVRPDPPRRTDVVIGHLDGAGAFAAYARRARAGTAWMAHGPGQFSRAPLCDVFIANSLGVQHELGLSAGVGAWLLRPHVDTARYSRGGTGSSVTLVNVSRWKGADMLRQLVAELGSVPFLGVRGAWGSQEWEAGRYGNLTVWATQPNINVALSATRLLLVPSRAESWGRIAVEAACRGIPAICADVPGLRESMGDAALYRHPDDVDGWAADITYLLGNKPAYRRLAVQARHRSEVLEQKTRLDADRVLTRLEERYG